MNFARWWSDIFANTNQYPESIELVKLSVSIMWKIWKARNSMSFYGDIYESNHVVNKALFDFHEYENNLLTTCSPIYVPDCTSDRNVVVVQDGVVLFADASLHKEKKMASIVVAAMDSCGSLLHAFGTQFNL